MKAFTLIETLLYLALFSIVFFAVVNLTISMTQSNSKAEFKNAVEKNSIFMTEHLNDTFMNGQTIDIANSTFDSNPGKIRVTSLTGYKEYSIVSGVFTVTDGTNTFSLSDRFVTISNFTVTQVLDSKGVLIGARIKITVTSRKFSTEYKTIETVYDFR